MQSTLDQKVIDFRPTPSPHGSRDLIPSCLKDDGWWLIEQPASAQHRESACTIHVLRAKRQ